MMGLGVGTKIGRVVNLIDWKKIFETADTFYARVYNLGDDWRVKR